MDSTSALSYLMGNEGVDLFIAKLFLGYLGAFLLSLWGTKKAVRTKVYSPGYFSWAYFWNDNSKRFIANLIVVFIGIRFMQQLFPPSVNEEVQLFTSLLVGLGVDALTNRLKKWKVLNVDPAKNPANTRNDTDQPL